MVDFVQIVQDHLTGYLGIYMFVTLVALMFSGMPSEFLGPGIVIMLVGTLVIGLAGTLFSQIETLAWYGAYPNLSVPNINDNGRLRRDLFRTLTKAELDALP